jgi:hypothetical protein
MEVKMAGQKIVKSKFFLEDDFLDTLAEVPAQEVGAWKPDKKLGIVGTSVSRVDGYDKVSGTAQYTFDVTLPHMAFAKTLRCPHPHARIKSIDTRAYWPSLPIKTPRQSHGIPIPLSCLIPIYDTWAMKWPAPPQSRKKSPPMH